MARKEKILKIKQRLIPVKTLPKKSTLVQIQRAVDATVNGAVLVQNKMIMAHSRLAFSILKTVHLKDNIEFDGKKYVVYEIGDASLNEERDESATAPAFTLVTCDFSDASKRKLFNLKEV